MIIIVCRERLNNGNKHHINIRTVYYARRYMRAMPRHATPHHAALPLLLMSSIAARLFTTLSMFVLPLMMLRLLMPCAFRALMRGAYTCARRRATRNSFDARARGLRRYVEPRRDATARCVMRARSATQRCR